MAFLFRDRGGSECNRQSATPVVAVSDLAPPFAKQSCDLSDSELRETAYEILVGACGSSLGMPLPVKLEKSTSLSPQPPSSPGTPTASSKMKRMLGLTLSSSFSSPNNSPGKESSPATFGELMRVRMSISEEVDSRVKRAMLRIAADLHGRRFESIVLPLELLQELKVSDFPTLEQYYSWQMRNLKVLEAGLIMHPLQPLESSNSASKQLKQIISGTSNIPIETGANSESMQALRSAVMSLACRPFDGSVPESSHWADGFPLNVQLYQKLLEACFNCKEEASIINEADELLELLKKTWVVLGINQALHDLFFSWVLFNHFIATGQVKTNLLLAAEKHLCEVANNTNAIKDLVHLEIFNSTLGSILGWVEKRLLAYHDMFNPSNVGTMSSIVSLGVSSGKILEDTSHTKNTRKRREQVDTARKKIECYIKSSVQTAFAQLMEKAALIRQSSKTHSTTTPFLYLLANYIRELSNKEMEVFSPILRRWHPLAAGIAVSTLHRCYGNELRQFIQRTNELTPDTAQVLEAADYLEKDLVQIAVEDAVNSDDGGKAIIREMPPYEAEYAAINLAKAWIKTRVDKLKEQIDNNLQQEVWDSIENKEKIADSAVEVLQIIEDTLQAFLQLPLTMHLMLLPDLIIGMDQSLLHYICRAKSGCGTRNTYIPVMPALTRCEPGLRPQGVIKQKACLHGSHEVKSEVDSLKRSDSFSLSQLCICLNTLVHIHAVLEMLGKRIISHLRNTKYSVTDAGKGVQNRFDKSFAACEEGIENLFETIAYKVVFHDLRHVLWDRLYVGGVASSRIDLFRRELDANLVMISSKVHSQIRKHVIMAIMKASFDGFLLVLLAGGPSRAFSCKDCDIIEDDFATLKEFYLANEDDLSEDQVDEAAAPVRCVLPLFRLETEMLIELFKCETAKVYGHGAKTKLPLPPTPTKWKSDEPNTILRVLCHRNDETASKFLKKTYNLPEKL